MPAHRAKKRRRNEVEEMDPAYYHYSCAYDAYFFIIDRFNSFMDFMTSEMSKWVFAALAVFAIASAVRLIAADWREDERERK